MRPVHLGPADRVTLVRAVLTAVVGGIVVAEVTGAGPTWARPAVVALGAVALVLDGVDGRVARRTGTASAAGARFDLETDAALVLVLSVLAAREVGGWVLLIGLARYLLLAAQSLVPGLRAPLRPRYWRKVVAVVQGVVLLVAVSGAVPAAVSEGALAVALALLALSFGTEAVERFAAGRARGAGPRARAATGLALVVGWAALVTPGALVAEGGALRWDWSAVRVPAEGLLLVAAALVLPPRLGRAVAVAVGTVVGVLLVLTALDAGFPLVLDRPFDVVGDWTYLVSAVEVVGSTRGPALAALLALASVAVAAGVVASPAWAFARVAATGRRHRSRAAPFVVAVTSIALVSAGATPGPGRGPGVVSTPSTTALADELQSVRATLADPRVFAREIASDPWADVPADRLLTALRGHDVLLVVVESYGRIALEDDAISPVVGRALAEGEDALAAAGYSARSAFLTSPTFGGGSWLAHSTLQSGTWVDSQRRYEQLTASSRLTLIRAFSRAGWRTVITSPATTRDWPEAHSFYGVDALYDARNSGYAGPSVGYGAAPDQYTLAHLAAAELAPGPRAPVMAEVDLVSSHHPWSPLPRPVPWEDVGDGSALTSRPADPGGGPSGADGARRAYAESVAYSLGVVTSFPTTVRDADLVLLVVGDHQPHHQVSGADPGRDVPVSVVSRDPHVLRAVDRWGWQPGLHPSPDAPVRSMASLRDLVLGSFSTAGEPAGPVLRVPR